MNVVLWLVAGAVVGWISYSALHLNGARGLAVSAMIAAGGAFFGGHILAPIFGHPDVVGGFSMLALTIAAVTALCSAYLGDALYERFGM